MAEAKLYRDRNLQIIFGVSLMAVLGVISITPAFPKMTEEWGISKQDIGLLITAFTLPGVVVVPFIGVLADRLGRKRILVPSLFLFGIAGGACALTRDFNTILVLRVFQGIGAAGMGSINTTIIGDLFSGRRRTEAMGLNASVSSIGIASYPIIGGALALLSCNYPFLLSLAAIPIGLIVLTSLHNPEPKNEQSLKDYVGGTWVYMKNPKVAGLFGAGTLTFILIYGIYLTYFTILMRESFHASPFIIGIVLSSISLSTALASSQLGRITRRFSEISLIKAAFPIYGLALVMIPLMPSLGLLFLPAVIFGIANGVSSPSIQTEVTALAPLEQRAAFMSINSMMIRLGQTLGPPLMGLVYVYTSLETTFFVAALLALAVPPIAMVLGRGIQHRGEV